MTADWGAIAVRAHAAYLTHLATSPLAETRRRGGVLAVATGVLSNVENGIAGSRLDPAEADRVIAELVRWLSVERRLPASWLCADDPEPPDLPDRLERAGCRADRGGIDMGVHLGRLARPPAPPRGVLVLRADDDPLLSASFDVFAACGWFDEPGDRERHYTVARTLAGRPVRRWVALRGDRAVGAVTAFASEGVLLLHEVATVEDERRRGIGRALVLAAAADGRAAGCDVAVLAPSPDGRKLADALGFGIAPTPADRWFYVPLAADINR